MSSARTVAKKKTLIASEQDRPDVVEWCGMARFAGANRSRQSRFHRRNVGENQHDPELRPLGTRHAFGGKDPVWTLADNDFSGALRAEGFIAPLTVEGTINGVLFRAWVEQHLAPALKPGDIVVMDNLSSHKVAGIRKAIEAAGAELRYLPPYSPDLNPIELAFSKFRSCSATAPNALSTNSGNSAAASSTSSRNPSAEIISNTADTATPKIKAAAQNLVDWVHDLLLVIWFRIWSHR